MGIRELAERGCFVLCRSLGRALRAGRYSKVRIVCDDGGLKVRKRRLFYAPLLVGIGGPLVRVMDTGVRILRQREWEDRERLMYRTLYDSSVRTDGDTLILPCLTGETLAALLEDPDLETSRRNRAIELAVIALREFHRAGFTHGDAMAENVLVDVDAGVARWFDFETVHDPSRPMLWRRADDVRALLATCLLRTPRETVAGTLRLILDVYGDEQALPILAASYTSVFRRPLVFHLGQAGLSFEVHREIGHLLREQGG